MDEEPAPAELPWWTVDPRTVFELDDASLAATRRVVRRSLAKADPAWRLTHGEAFEEVLDACGRARGDGDGVWLSARMKAMYRELERAGFATTYELWDDDTWIAGVVAVRLGRAAMLESMTHRVPHAGNALLVRLLGSLAAEGVALCDVQTPTPHTTRLGAVPIPRAQYERRLAAAIR